MNSQPQTLKILDASAGESTEFDSPNNLLKYKLVISGNPGSNIKAFCIEQKELSLKNNIFYLKIYCSNWGDASVSLQAKSNNVDDEFSDVLTEPFSSNQMKLFDY